MGAATPILQVRDLHKSFGELEVLKGIDLDVADRELVFIIGPSGSGKSTFLRCCNRLEEPTRGAIEMQSVTSLGGALKGPSVLLRPGTPACPGQS